MARRPAESYPALRRGTSRELGGATCDPGRSTSRARRSAEPEATTNEHAATNEATKARAHRAQRISMVTRVGNDTLVLRSDRFNAWAPKASTDGPQRTTRARSEAPSPAPMRRAQDRRRDRDQRDPVTWGAWVLGAGSRQRDRAGAEGRSGRSP
eukprot:4300925-Pleurochrysis_carterae.AAC.1